MTNTNPKRVKISARNVGQSFGTVGVVKALNGRTLETTDPRPYGFTSAALAAAESQAARKGWVVVNPA